MTKKDSVNEHSLEDIEKMNLDHPENIPTDNVSIFDMHEDMQTVDTIALDDLREEMKKEAINTRGKSGLNEE